LYGLNIRNLKKCVKVQSVFPYKDVPQLGVRLEILK